MRQTLTISLPADTKRKLDRIAKQERVNRSDVVREALNRYFTIIEFQKIRMALIPEAEKRGLYTEQDVFGQVS
jgi:predicted transcriptional regulator